jgi:hypothetical protein
VDSDQVDADQVDPGLMARQLALLSRSLALALAYLF